MAKKDLTENTDYYIENGKWVFTAKYHLDRKYCCSPQKTPGCRHCPYRVKENSESSNGHSPK